MSSTLHRGARRPIEGFGFLVPRASELPLLGCLYMSQLFPGRAPEGRELLQCMIGGLRRPDLIDLPDDTIAELVQADLDRVLGLAGAPDVLGVGRWPRAVAQPGVDHVGRISRIRSLLGEQPNLELAGSYLEGVSVPDTFASGIAAARRVLAS